MSVLPRGWQSGEKQGIPLRVIQKDGVKYEPDISFTKTKLSNGSSYFYNNSGETDSFSVTILISRWDFVTGVELSYREWNTLWEDFVTEDMVDSLDDFVDAASMLDVTEVLDAYIRRGVPFYVFTRAIGVDSDSLWLVTKQASRKQSHDDEYMEWDLTFTRYTPLVQSFYKNDNEIIQKAIKKVEDSLKPKLTNKQQLAKCDYKVLKYSKEKKIVKCVKIMQKILYNEGHFKCKKTTTDKKTGKKTTTTSKANCKKENVVTGWYNDDTREAVKSYQKKHHKDYGLPITGNVGVNTYKCLCGKGKEVKAAKDKKFGSSGITIKTNVTGTVHK